MEPPLFTKACLLYETSKIVYWRVIFTIYDMAIQGVTRGYGGNKRLQEVTRGYRRLQGVTKGYKGLQGVTRGGRELQGVTGGYKKL